MYIIWKEQILYWGQLQVHNPKINWKTGEIKITRCLLLCRRNTKLEEGQKAKKEKRTVILEKEKIVKQAIDDEEDWEKEKKAEAEQRKIEEIVPRKFLKWRKVFGKIELERILIRKIWDYAIDYKREEFILYPKMKEKKLRTL